MQTVSFIGQGINSWSQLIPLINEKLYPVLGALNLHSNSLDQIDPTIFQHFTGLRKLDLSSNNVTEF
jgi:Leucine-rich repeat (LRR) protein